MMDKFKPWDEDVEANRVRTPSDPGCVLSLIPIRDISAFPSINRSIGIAQSIIARRLGQGLIVGSEGPVLSLGISRRTFLTKLTGASELELQSTPSKSDSDLFRSGQKKARSREKIGEINLLFPIEHKTGPCYSTALPNVKDDAKVEDVPARLLNFLQERLGYRLPQVAVQRSRLTDQMLAANRAEGMTLGSTVFVKRDFPGATSAQGAGLLAHELTHVAQQQGTHDWRTPMPHTRSGEGEPTALSNERLAALSFPTGIGHGSTVRSSQAIAGNPHASAAQFAADTRSQTSVTEEAPQSPPGMSPDDLEHIKEEIYRDLMLRIKTEFERGA